MDKGGQPLSAEKAALLETMGILIQDYDDRKHELAPLPGHAMLDYGMETRGRASEVLAGKRSISKAQAKKLAALFKVSADLFL